MNLDNVDGIVTHPKVVLLCVYFKCSSRILVWAKWDPDKTVRRICL